MKGCWFMNMHFWLRNGLHLPQGQKLLFGSLLTILLCARVRKFSVSYMQDLLPTLSRLLTLAEVGQEVGRQFEVQMVLQ